MRRRLHPLSVHLGMAAANMPELNAFAQKLSNTITEHDAIKMMRGIQMYQNSTFAVKKTNVEEVYCENGAKLITIKNSKHEKNARPFILVPSLINKSYIFDLSCEYSILKWLSESGIKTYIFDWGELNSNDTFQTVIENRLKPALHFLASKSQNKEIDVLGYCMGGTLLLSYYSSLNVNIKNMIALASPWNFEIEEMKLSQHVRIVSSLMLPEIDRKTTLPSEWIQALFASVDPNGTARKFINFSQMEHDDPKSYKFITVEDWLNDGVDLPNHIARECIQDWFVENKLHQSEPLKIGANIMIVASSKDKLVPYKSAIAVTESIKTKNITTHQVHTGHIGLVVGRKAISEVWKPIREFLISK